MRLMKWPERRANGWLFWGGYKPKGSRVAQQPERKEGTQDGQDSTKLKPEMKAKQKQKEVQNRPERC